MGDSESESTLHNNSLWWLACGMLALLANSWIILSITAKQQKHKPLELLLCFLAGTHILMAAVPLTTYAVVQLRRESSNYDWNESSVRSLCPHTTPWHWPPASQWPPFPTTECGW